MNIRVLPSLAVPLSVVIILLCVACTKTGDMNTGENDKAPILGEEVHPQEQPGEVPPMREPLFALLDDKVRMFYENEDPKIIEIYDKGIDDVRISGAYEHIKHIDDYAPDFALTDIHGDTIRLQSLLEKQPVILLWYWGAWSDFCTTQLAEMQQYYDYIRKSNAAVIAVSPQIPDSAASMAKRRGIEYPLLYDKGNAAAKLYGLTYPMPKPLLKELSKKANIAAYIGGKPSEFTFTMSYVIDQQGKIRYAFGDADYRKRAEPHEMIDVLRDCKTHP